MTADNNNVGKVPTENTKQDEVSQRSAMRKLFTLLLSFASLFLVFLENGIAQTATFKDGVLTVPHAAVLKADGVDYFADIQLKSGEDGRFELLGADPRNLVDVESIAVNVQESLPIQVTVVVTGNKSLPCTKLLEPGIFTADGTFTIALAESKLGPAETCIAVIDPFETTINLDISALAPGTYSVSVNGVSSEFTL
ncbi:MAG: hypothetical protein AB8B95_00120 [Pseudohongiellaceae bacterium]